MSKEKQIWERPGYDFDPPYPASTPVITNYDRLISKSPEELAEKWLDLIACTDCPVDKSECDMAWNKCSKAALDWLKSPVEEGT